MSFDTARAAGVELPVIGPTNSGCPTVRINSLPPINLDTIRKSFWIGRGVRSYNGHYKSRHPLIENRSDPFWLIYYYAFGAGVPTIADVTA
jgi:hypothetical protein